jgi:hypothetical protein
MHDRREVMRALLPDLLGLVLGVAAYRLGCELEHRPVEIRVLKERDLNAALLDPRPYNVDRQIVLLDDLFDGHLLADPFLRVEPLGDLPHLSRILCCGEVEQLFADQPKLRGQVVL